MAVLAAALPTPMLDALRRKIGRQPAGHRPTAARPAWVRDRHGGL
jgi:hypothetical protein